MRFTKWHAFVLSILIVAGSIFGIARYNVAAAHARTIEAARRQRQSYRQFDLVAKQQLRGLTIGEDEELRQLTIESVRRKIAEDSDIDK